MGEVLGGRGWRWRGFRLRGGGSWYFRAFQRAATGFGEPGVFEFAAEQVIGGDAGEVGLHAEDIQHLEKLAEGSAGRRFRSGEAWAG